MNRPPAITYVLGNPITVLVTLGLAAWAAAAYYQGKVDSPTGVVLFAIVAAVPLKAQDSIAKYRAWKREWDSYGPPQPTFWARYGGMIDGAGLLAVAAILWSSVQSGTKDGAGVFVLTLMIVVPFYGLRILLFLFRHRKPRSPKPGKPLKTIPVSIALSRPGLGAPSVEAAYAALPDHCRALLTPTRTD